MLATLDLTALLEPVKPGKETAETSAKTPPSRSIQSLGKPDTAVANHVGTMFSL